MIEKKTGGIASALAGGAMSKLFGGGQTAASGGIQGDVLATDNNTVGMGDAGIKSAIQGSNVPNPDEAVPSVVSGAMAKAGKGLLFFFSSRRRHTRWTGDWSSDVCSSDLFAQKALGQWKDLGRRVHSALFQPVGVLHLYRKTDTQITVTADVLSRLGVAYEKLSQEIGRASCRERV